MVEGARIEDDAEDRACFSEGVRTRVGVLGYFCKARVGSALRTDVIDRDTLLSTLSLDVLMRAN